MPPSDEPHRWARPWREVLRSALAMGATIILLKLVVFRDGPGESVLEGASFVPFYLGVVALWRAWRRFVDGPPADA